MNTTEKTNPPTPQDSFIRLPAVMAMTGLSRSSIYAKMKERTFPQNIKLGKRAACHLRSEVNQWINDRISESRPQSK